MPYNQWLERESRKEGKRDHILVVGSTALEVAERGRIVEKGGLFKPDGDILKSDYTGDWYQHWRRARDVSQPG